MPLLKMLEALDNVHLVTAVGIALCILLWYAANLENDKIVKDVLRQHRHRQRQHQDKPYEQQQQEHGQLKKTAEAARISKAPSSPDPCQTFRRLNPIQSVERQQLRRSKSAAVDNTTPTRATAETTATTAATATAATPATPCLCQNFRCLNPLQSVERHRRLRYDLQDNEGSSN
ncbi:hypothetical protein ACLKA7_003130 [Drosophila subpalustris]